MSPPPRAELLARTASRVLLLDAENRVLLFRGWDPADKDQGSWWLTPGGGLDEGEDPAVGATRELYEETGLRLAPKDLTGPVHEEIVEFGFDGRWYRQSQRFYLARCHTWEVDRAGHSEVELRSVGEHRWWSVSELRATEDQVYPADLADLLERLTRGA